MKKIIIFSFLLIVIYFTNNYILSSTPCLPCSSNCTWQAPYNPPYSYGPEESRFITSGVTYGNSTCYFAVKFKMSECYCPELRRELFIESIELLGGGDCNNITKAMIMQRAIQQLLYESSVIFDIENPGYPFDIVVKVPSCMKKSFTEVYVDDCNNSCCETKYTLQLTDNQGQPPNSVVLLSKITNNPQVNCPGLTQNQCQNICESNDAPLGPLFPDYNFSCPSGDPCVTAWDTRPKVQSFTIGNCTFAAYFYTRDNCYHYNLQRYLKEVKIQKVVLVTPGCSSLPSNGTILNTALKKILYNPGRWFNNDVCILIHTRVYECWVNINSRLLIPCNQYTCCSYSYWVARTERYPYYEYRTQFPSCETYGPDAPEPDKGSGNCENGCSNYCDSVFVGYDTELFPRLSTSEDEGPLTINPEYVLINPNPADNLLKISINSSIKTEYVLTITDILGNIVFKQNGQKERGLSEFSVDLQKFKSGTYFYQVGFGYDKNLIKSGKFVIIK